MSSRITYIDEDASFEVGDKRHRIIRINLKNILRDEDIQKFGRELCGYIDGTGENSDSNANYCLSLKGVNLISSLILRKFIMVDKKLIEREKKGLAIVSTIPAVYELFAITKLDKLFSFYDSVKDYKDRMINQRV